MLAPTPDAEVETPSAPAIAVTLVVSLAETDTVVAPLWL